MENQLEASSAQSEGQPPQSQSIKPKKSGLKKLGLVLLIACPIILVLFLPGYAIVMYIFQGLGTDVSEGTQKTVKILFQLIGILSVIGVPLGGILYSIGKKSESKQNQSSNPQM